MAENDGAISFERREVLSLTLRFMAALAAVAAVALLLGYWARPAAESIARLFVRSFGVWGMGVGTLLADGFHFPVPPQFYMLLAVASGTPTRFAFAAIAFASFLAGFVGYGVAHQAARIAWVRRKLEQPRRLLLAAYERYGFRAALALSLLPIPYSVLCYLAGVNRLPRAFLGLLATLRVPKLAAFYYLVHLGWSFS